MGTQTAREQYPNKKHSTKPLTIAGLDDGRRSVTIDKGHYFMRSIHRSLRHYGFALALSMSALPNLVNAQPQSLTSVNKDKSSTKSDLKDSVKDAKADIAQLISVVLEKGANENIGSNLAPIIGLPKAMPVKDVGATISKRHTTTETRRCFVVYEEVKNPGMEDGTKRPLCAYVMRTKRWSSSKETRYFRIDLKGKLEKAILSQGKYDEAGKVVIGSGVKTDLDIDSPEVRKTFEAEMNFWLKDWLKKEQKNAAKKTADAATKKPSTTAL